MSQRCDAALETPSHPGSSYVHVLACPLLIIYKMHSVPFGVAARPAKPSLKNSDANAASGQYTKPVFQQKPTRGLC